MRSIFYTITMAVSILLLGVLVAPSPAQDQADAQAAPDAGPRLRWIEFSVAGQTVRVKAGGVLALHPDAPFMVLKAVSDSWLNLGMSTRIQEAPSADLSQYHTLKELLRENVYNNKGITVQAFKDGQLLGQVKVLPRLLPIDWLRRAQATDNLDEKINYTRQALELTPDDRLLLRRLVDLYVEAHRYKEAVEIVEQIEASQEDPNLLRRLAELYRRLEQPQKEAAALSKLLAESPQDRILMLRLAELNQKLERWQEAAMVLEKLLQGAKGKERIRVYHHLAQVLAKAGRPQESLAAWNNLASLKPRDPKIWRELAQVRKKAGDEKGALKALRQAAALNPQDQALQLSLASDLAQAGEKRQAAEALERIAAQDPDDAVILLRLINLYQEIGDQPALLRAYQRLIKARPEDPVAAYNLAVLAMEQGKLEMSLEALGKAAKLKPEDKEIQGLTLEVLIKLKQWKKVTALAKKTLKADPGNLEVLAAVYTPLARHRPSELASILDQILKSKPKQAKYYELRAALALEQQDAEAATKALALGVKVLPDDIALQEKLLDLYESEGKDNDAIKLLTRMLKKRPKDIGLLGRLAALYESNQKDAEAINILKSIHRLKPQDLSILFKMAELHEAQGQDEQAMKLLARILDKDPDYPQAQERYLRLKTSQLRNKKEQSTPQ
jgi:tetratricopeptide (TPR) repeat protein